MILNFLGWFVVYAFFLFWLAQYLTTFGYDCFTSQTQRIGMSFCAALVYVGALITVIGFLGWLGL